MLPVSLVILGRDGINTYVYTVIGNAHQLLSHCCLTVVLKCSTISMAVNVNGVETFFDTCVPPNKRLYINDITSIV